MTNQSLRERDYQIEKLEFALEISRSNGNKLKSVQLKYEIKKIGFNYEETGT